MEYLFWFSFFMIFYSYIGYPILLLFLSRCIAKRHNRSAEIIPVTLIISAFNEEDCIRSKIENSLSLDYPSDKLEILVVSDASSDNTDQIVRQYEKNGVILVRQERRAGKTAGLNLAVAQAHGEIIVFSDANSMYQKDAINKLIQHFADSHIGYVVGEARYSNPEETRASRSENTYWQYEIMIKTMESKIHSVVGGDGAIYAIRKNLYEKMLATDINDFVNPLQIVLKGYRGVYEPQAICWESAAGSFQKEFRRKYRIVNRSFNGLIRVISVLNPFKTGIFSLEVFSHKLIRWLAPVFLILMATCSVFLAANSIFFEGFLIATVIFCLLACIGFAFQYHKKISPIFFYPFYFILINAASLLGIYKTIRGEVLVTWEPVRTGEKTTHSNDVANIACKEQQGKNSPPLNILFLAPRIPYPPNKGDKIRSFNEIQYLSKRHNIYLCTTLDHPSDERFVDELRKYCVDVYYTYFNRKWKLVRNFFKTKPFSIIYFYDKAIQDYVDNILASGTINVVICYCSSMAEYIYSSSSYRNKRLNHVKLIVDYVDLDSDKWLQYSKYSSFPLDMIYNEEYRRLSNYEIRTNREFTASIFVAEREINVFKKLNANLRNTYVISNGVDFAFFSPRPKMHQNKKPTLVFTGFMNYFANEDGVNWFCHKIFPLIKQEIPETEFFIVGANPTDSVYKLELIDGVKVTGYVEDIREYYWMADVCVIPLRIARGLQNKVLEAMATGNAVVATSNANNGIISRHGENIFIADDEQLFAEMVITLLKDKGLRETLGDNAVKNVQKHYSWEENLKSFNNIFFEDSPQDVQLTADMPEKERMES